MPVHQKKRKFEMGRVPASTKIGEKRIILVRGRGKNMKHRALKLDHGNFSWGSESQAMKTRIIDVVYNAHTLLVVLECRRPVEVRTEQHHRLSRQRAARLAVACAGSQSVS